VNETDSSDEDDLAYDAKIKAESEFKRLLWDQLTIEERVVMKAYKNNITNNKTIHVRLMTGVNTILERYPEFDLTCVP